MEEVLSSHSTYAKSVEIFLENSVMLPHDALKEAQRAERKSEAFMLIESFLELARQHCEDEELESGSAKALAALEEAHSTATSITFAYAGLLLSMEERKALSPAQVTENYALRVPSHVTNLAMYVKEKGKLKASQAELSWAVGIYVRGRFKSPEIDRVLAQILTQVEMVAYMDEMLCKDLWTGTSRLEEARPGSVVKAVWNFLKLVFALWLMSLGIAALPLAFSRLSANAMLFVGLGLGALGTIALLVLLVIVVSDIIRQKPSKKRLQGSILEMIDQMNGFFLEFKSSGPLSTSHFKKRVDDLAQARVVWPSGLFVLLDDIEARGVRIF